MYIYVYLYIYIILAVLRRRRIFLSLRISLKKSLLYNSTRVENYIAVLQIERRLLTVN